jgi:hypothetical protein
VPADFAPLERSSQSRSITGQDRPPPRFGNTSVTLARHYGGQGDITISGQKARISRKGRMNIMIRTPTDGAPLTTRSRHQKRPLIAAQIAVCAALLGALVCTSEPAQAQFTQQGNYLVGGGAAQPSEQGFSVSLSNNGNTAIIGGPTDDGAVGAAWIFTRSAGV